MLPALSVSKHEPGDVIYGSGDRNDDLLYLLDGGRILACHLFGQDANEMVRSCCTRTSPLAHATCQSLVPPMCLRVRPNRCPNAEHRYQTPRSVLQQPCY